MASVCIGLGSNIGDAERNVERAIAALARLGCVRACSSLYRSKAWGVREQPDFVNAALLLETELAPLDLLRALKGLERELGREPTYRWGPRLIDLDLLTYDDLALRSEELTLPHPGLFERAFVLAPLAEIQPAYREAYERLPAEVRGEVRGGIRPNNGGFMQSLTWEKALERVRGAVETCVAADWERLRIEEAGFSAEIRRSPQPARPLVEEPQHEELVPHAAADAHLHVLKADFVGIVRLSKPQVVEGSAVSEGRELAYVESLGTRNPIRAAQRGTIRAVHVVDGQPVDYGRPLFTVEYGTP